ncbi:MAG: heme-binding protein [Candidatus Bathyarchaeia archaeon]
MVESPNYEVTRKLDDVEIRKYPSIFLATAKGDADLFSLLFRYISGANRGSKKISMTAPVITPEKIAMTSPVFTDADSMSFIVPSMYTRETVPEPTDPHITIQEQPARSMAVLRFSGWARNDTIEKKKKILLDTLHKNNIEPKGEVVLMRYNPPFTPWFLRRNEVAVEVNI